jgi:type IX secretion system PorP/SprF family membrane protein
MNKFFLGITIILFPFQIFGQMFPSSDHYVFNALVINPAFAGCNEALSANISYRNQWVGFKDSPKNYSFSVHAPVHEDKIGLGLMVERNSVGIFKETNIIANYAYRMKLFNGKLALGLGIGATIINTAWNDLAATDPGDVQLSTNSVSDVLPNFSMGAFYFTQKYFIGISAPLFLSHELDQSTGKYTIENNFSKYNYFITSGYKLGINSQFKIVPSLLVKYHPHNPIQIDYNMLFNLRDKFWLGVGYRSKSTLIAMIQCQLNYQIRMAYSYDYEFGGIGKYTNGSHEIVLNYIFRYSRKVMGPKQF